MQVSERASQSPDLQGEIQFSYVVRVAQIKTQGAYGNGEEAKVTCERQPDGIKSILEDTSLMDKTDDPIVLPHASVLRPLMEDDKNLSNTERLSSEPAYPKKI